MDVLNQIDAALSWPLGTAALCIAALCGVCAVIARFLSAPASGAGLVYKAVYAVINWLAQNHGKAANADDMAKLKDR